MKLFQWFILGFLLSGGALLNPIFADDAEVQEEEGDEPKKKIPKPKKHQKVKLMKVKKMKAVSKVLFT